MAYFVWDQVLTSFPGLLPARVLWQAQTMDHLLDAPLARPRLGALLLAGSSLGALLLSAIGLYGVMTWGVRRQTHDIGVRVALGATPGKIRRLVLAQAFGLVGIGVIAGLAGALVASRLPRSMLFRVSPTHPLTLAGGIATAARRLSDAHPVVAHYSDTLMGYEF